MLALCAGACVRTVAAEVTSTSGRSVVASSGAHRYIPRARDGPARAASSSAGCSAGWRAARVIAPLRAAASPRLGIGNPRGGAVVANARAGRSSGSHGSSANDPDEHEQEREMLNNVQPSKSPEKKNNRPPAVADQPAKKPSSSSSASASSSSASAPAPDAVEAKAKTEKFELDKKRLELIMEEKEWDLERVGSDPAEKMERLSEYVTAVEAYKTLCSTQVPNTVSDLLSQYVQVHALNPGAGGYDKAVEFLNLDFADDDDDRDPEEIEAIRRMAKNFGRGTGGAGAGDEDPGFTPKEVDDIIRLLGEMGELRRSDGDDDDDEEVDEEELMRNFLGGFLDNPGTLHLAQDVEGNWRWLEDDLGRPLATKPEGEFNVKVMSHEEMVQLGLNVNSLHEEVDPAELIDFSGCKSWDEAIRVGREVEAALDHMRADGWEVDTRSWCNEGEHLMVVKELTPLRTMSFVEGVKGKSSAKSKRKAGKNSKKTEGKA